MRAVGIPEDKVTGNASDWDKFYAFAQTMPQIIGNPIHHWSHLELQRAFGITVSLNPETAHKIYDEANEQLKNYSARQLMRKFQVKAVCTTDDPVDDLHWHEIIAADKTRYFPHSVRTKQSILRSLALAPIFNNCRLRLAESCPLRNR